MGNFVSFYIDIANGFHCDFIFVLDSMNIIHILFEVLGGQHMF